MHAEPIESLTGGYGIQARFHDYSLVPVYKNTTPEIRRHILALWARNGVTFGGEDAEERAKQVVFLAIGPQGNIAGVNSVYLDDLCQKGIAHPPPDKFYFYRMFVQASDRVHNLAPRMVTGAFEHLQGVAAREAARGVVIVAENPKIAKRAAQRRFQAAGWKPIGNDYRGHLVMRRDFDFG